jgi:preprotein translocase subunit SecG
MLYPAQNACAAGDRFAPDQLGALQQFTRYQSMPFELPWLQRLANVITLLTVIATVLLLVVSLVLQVIPMKCKQRHCNGS